MSFRPVMNKALRGANLMARSARAMESTLGSAAEGGLMRSQSMPTQLMNSAKAMRQEVSGQLFGSKSIPTSFAASANALPQSFSPTANLKGSLAGVQPSASGAGVSFATTSEDVDDEGATASSSRSSSSSISAEGDGDEDDPVHR